MKTRNFIFLLAGLALALISSCTDMNDNIKEYLDRGEINYLGRPDSASVAGGDNRVSISWLVKSDPRIEAYAISWTDLDNKKQEISGAINRSALNGGYMSVVLDIPESSYLFNITHTGSKGYNSIGAEVSGSSYGDAYRSQLLPRGVASITGYADHVEIVWAAADRNLVDLDLTYETASGSQKTITVAADETQTKIYDNKEQGRYSYITYFKPEATAIDKFGVASTGNVFPVIAYKLSKAGWTATAATNHPWGTGPMSVIDGNNSTYWHSGVDLPADDPNRPLFIEVDMKSAKTIASITVDERYDVRKLEIRSSLDGSDWTILGSLTYGSGEHGIATLTLINNISARYLRFYVIESSNADGRGGIFEIDVVGKD